MAEQNSLQRFETLETILQRIETLEEQFKAQHKVINILRVAQAETIQLLNKQKNKKDKKKGGKHGLQTGTRKNAKVKQK